MILKKNLSGDSNVIFVFPLTLSLFSFFSCSVSFPWVLPLSACHCPVGRLSPKSNASSSLTPHNRYSSLLLDPSWSPLGAAAWIQVYIPKTGNNFFSSAQTVVGMLCILQHCTLTPSYKVYTILPLDYRCHRHIEETPRFPPPFCRAQSCEAILHKNLKYWLNDLEVGAIQFGSFKSGVFL